MLTVTVNDRPLDVGAIVERGRVLLPMRATFAALGARIEYHPQSGIIVARDGKHLLTLREGDATATLDGQTMRMDVPPHEIAARTYVPLRFIAQAFGAVVGYDAKAQLVSVTARTLGTATGQNGVTALSPAPDAAVASAYPTISATLSGASAAQNAISLQVDGADVTSLAAFDGTTITYMPRAGLPQGAHSVVFSGTTNAGTPFSAQWSFNTNLAAPADAQPFTPTDFRFYTSGPSIYRNGDLMHFVLIAPPNGSAQLQLCGFGAFPFVGNPGGMMYTVSLPAPPGVRMPSCQVTAVYTAWNGVQTYVPVPIFIGLYTAVPRARSPQPSHTLRPLPNEPRRTPQPAPRPTPAPPAPAPTAAPRTPLPLPHPHPKPRRTPGDVIHELSAATASAKSSVFS